MGLIFRGMVLVLLDINVTWNAVTIGLLPDWLGFWWLAKGFAELEEEWNGFRKGRTPVLALAAYSAVLYGMDLMALSARGELLRWGLGLIGAFAAAAVVRMVGGGVSHMEKKQGWELRSEKLRGLWLYLAVLLVLGKLLDWVPVVGTVCGVAVAVMAVCYLAALWDTGKRYGEYRK